MYALIYNIHHYQYGLILFFEKYSTKVWYKRKDILTLHSQTRNKHS